MKRSIMILALFIVFVGAVSGCAIHSREEAQVRTRLEDYLLISIPHEGLMQYDFTEKDGFTGRRGQYTVFSFDEEPTEFLNENKFFRGRVYGFESGFDFGFTYFCERNGVPNQYQFDWSEPYQYKIISHSYKDMYLVYFTGLKTLVAYIPAY